jgi:Xaa-Pro dipeptidase
MRGAIMNLNAIQAAIKEAGLDGWLFYDFSNRDIISYRILGLDEKKHTARRWYYLIPAVGEPTKLVSAVEPIKLDTLPGEKIYYQSWESRHEALKKIAGKVKKVAMQYSPMNNIPYVSTIDAGTIELLRSFGLEIVSSADLIQKFEGLIDEKGYDSHFEAGRIIHRIKDEAFEEIGKFLREGKKLTEYDVQQYIDEKFDEAGLTCDGAPPIIGVNEHAADPHFDPTPDVAVEIKKGDIVLIDLWARFDNDRAIYYDITWMGFAGKQIPARLQEIWQIVRDARDACIEFETKKITKGDPCFAWELDKVCREKIEQKGYGKYFVHRTGHSIGHEVHGNAANLDNFETKDERMIVPGILHSVEPGIYIPDEKIGVRSEVNVYVSPKNEVIVTGPSQMDIIKIDC